MKSLNGRSTAEVMKLETEVLSPTECANDGQVLMAIEQWEGALKRYLDAGGEDLSAKRRQGGLLRLLPETLRNKVIWDLGEDKPAEVVIEWLQKRLVQSNAWNNKGQPAAMVEPEEDEEPTLDEEAMEELHALGEQGSTMDVAAIFQRNAKRFARPGSKPFVPRRQPFQPRSAQRERAPGAQRDNKDKKCANCLKEGHTAAECRQPKCEKRKCFLCLGEGHQARNCPNKDKNVPAHARLLEETFTVDADGFVPIQRKKPEPRKATLADFMTPVKKVDKRSVFSKFAEFIEDDGEVAVLKAQKAASPHDGEVAVLKAQKAASPHDNNDISPTTSPGRLRAPPNGGSGNGASTRSTTAMAKASPSGYLPVGSKPCVHTAALGSRPRVPAPHVRTTITTTGGGAAPSSGAASSSGTASTCATPLARRTVDNGSDDGGPIDAPPGTRPRSHVRALVVGSPVAPYGAYLASGSTRLDNPATTPTG